MVQQLTTINPILAPGNQPVNDDLTAISNLLATGIVIRSATATWLTRSIVGGDNITITNANGVDGNPTINLEQGPGSGLDADTIDGVHESALAKLAGATFAALKLANVGPGLDIQDTDSTGTMVGTVAFKDASGTRLADFGFNGNTYAFLRTYASTTRIYGTYTDDATVLEVGNSSATLDGNTMWHAGNDGSGSGLDADLLDGHQGSYYMVSSSSPTSDINDFTVSGTYRLGASTTNAPNGSGYGQVLTLHGSGDTIAQIVFPYSNPNPSFRIGNPSQVGGLGNYSDWYTIWNSGNDGAGSSLDADLLDGQEGSYYRAFSNMTGTISEAQIADKAVGTAAYKVKGDRDCVNLDPYFEDATLWAATGVSVVAESTAQVGTTVLQIGSSYVSQYYDQAKNIFPIDATRTYCFEIRVRRVSGTGSFYGVWHFKDTSLATLAHDSSWEVASGSDSPFGVNSSNCYFPAAVSPTEWTTYRLFIGPNGEVKFPTGTVAANFGFLSGYTDGGTYQIDYVRVTEIKNDPIVVSEIGQGNRTLYRYFAPKGASYATAATTVVGAIEIRLPKITYHTGLMMSFNVCVFNYSTGKSFEVAISGYNYTSGWINPTAYIIGSPNSDRNFTVRFGKSNSTYDCVWIGETTSSWDYPQIGITNVVVGFANHQISLEQNWQIDIVSTLGTVESTITNTQVGSAFNGNTIWNSGNDGSGSGLDADKLDGYEASAFAKLTGADFTSDIAIKNPNSGVSSGMFVLPQHAINTSGSFTAGSFYSANLYGISLNYSIDSDGTPTGRINTYNAGTMYQQIDFVTSGGVHILQDLYYEKNNPVANFIDTGHTGNTSQMYINFYDAANTRYGFIGKGSQSNSTIHLYAEQGVLNLVGTASSDATTLVVGNSTATLDGNTMWHAGNDGSGSGLDADLLDGLNSASFLRSNANGSLTAYIAVGTSNRNGGIIGTYDSTKTQQIWAMGSSYLNAADGTDFGSLYGFAYKHTNNPTGGTMAGGHQGVWCSNGTPVAALGSSIWTSGNVIAYSDRRVKKNLQRIENALSKVIQLNGYSYDRTDIEAHQIGVVAQEVMEIFPALVSGDETAYSVAYGNFAGVFIEAFKEVNDILEEQKATIESQSEEIKDLKQTLNDLAKRIANLEQK